MRGLVQCHVQNCKILKIMVGGRGVAVRGIKFCRGPRKLRFVGLSSAVAPINYMFTKKGEVMVIASRSLCKYDRRESPCKTSRYIIKND